MCAVLRIRLTKNSMKACPAVFLSCSFHCAGPKVGTWVVLPFQFTVNIGTCVVYQVR